MHVEVRQQPAGIDFLHSLCVFYRCNQVVQRDGVYAYCDGLDVLGPESRNIMRCGLFGLGMSLALVLAAWKLVF